MIVKQVIKTMIDMRLKEVAKSNPFPVAESSGLWSENEMEEMECFGMSDIKEGDIVVSYDYNTDELKGHGVGEYAGSECEKWLTWYEDILFNGIHQLMSELGYVEIDENDGSGGGLYYGGLLYRKESK